MNSGAADASGSNLIRTCCQLLTVTSDCCRQVEIFTGIRQWYTAGESLVPIRWVYVHDKTRHSSGRQFLHLQAEALAATDHRSFHRTLVERDHVPGSTGVLGPRNHLRMDSEHRAPRQRCLGCMRSWCLLYLQLLARARGNLVQWSGRKHLTFSDVITAVRRWLWLEWAFKNHADHRPFARLSAKTPQLVLYALAQAA
jgi:hypothetical protein